MKLIITEKDNAARRIAEILQWRQCRDGSRARCQRLPMGRHALCSASPGTLSVSTSRRSTTSWRDVEPAELIEAPIEKTATRGGHRGCAQRCSARRADHVTIATDYDREGELIGKEAYEIVRSVNEDIPIDRVRFSSITENEVQSAFDDPETLDFDLAEAGRGPPDHRSDAGAPR
ncbi:MAG: toprim domain-containing protein [Natrialbaceae archaeon]|nr:toprim domain-containing protein [Natrialbaceae archaeon]